jgi:hypothetical protein
MLARAQAWALLPAKPSETAILGLKTSPRRESHISNTGTERPLQLAASTLSAMAFGGQFLGVSSVASRNPARHLEAFRPRRRSQPISPDIPRMTILLGLRLSVSTDFGNANSSTRGLPCMRASDIGTPGAGNADFVVIQTHLSLCF